jgi:LysR family nitrogen assimilation transcriptional regulator
VKLETAWEVSAVPAIIDLVAAGHGHAVLTASAIAESGQAARLVFRPIVEPPLVTQLALAVSATRRPTPLVRHLMARLPQLAKQVSGQG